MEPRRPMAEVLVVYAATATDARGVVHTARACARRRHDGWVVWFELEPLGGGSVLRTDRETTQPDREAAARWARGISRVYLEGALARATASHGTFERPSTTSESAPERDAVLDPLEVVACGETHLQRRLEALSTDHLRDVARTQRTMLAGVLANATKGELVAAIVAQTRERA